MKKIKNLGYKFLLLFTCIGLLVTTSNCTSDDKDDIKVQTFLEKYDGTKWTVIDEGALIYLRINDDMGRPLELWLADANAGKGLTDIDCYYYSNDLLDMEEVEGMEIIENSESKLVFSYYGMETWTLSMEGNRLKMGFKSANNERDPVYLDKTNEDVDSFEICQEE